MPLTLSGTLLSGALLSGGSNIDFDGGLLLVLVIFGLLFFALQRLLFRPMVALFDERSAAIDGARSEARDLETEAEQKLKTFEAEMKKAMVAATADRESIQKDGVRLERELLARARADADKVTEEATAQMTSEGAKVRADMKIAIPALAASIVEKILGRRPA